MDWSELSEAERQAIIYTVLGEAAGEGADGMAAVAWVIRNRATSGTNRFPDSPAAVALQKNGSGVYEFSAWNTKALGGNNPRVRYAPTSGTYKRAEWVTRRVMEGSRPDPTGGSKFYRASYIGQPYWWAAESKGTEVRIGRHIFLAEHDPSNAALAAIQTAVVAVQKVAPVPLKKPSSIIYQQTKFALEKPGFADPTMERLRQNVLRMPDPSRTTTQRDAIIEYSDLAKTYRSGGSKSTVQPPVVLPAEARDRARANAAAKAGTTELVTRKVKTVPVDLNTGTVKSPLQVAVERKAQQMATQKAAEMAAAAKRATPAVQDSQRLLAADAARKASTTPAKAPAAAPAASAAPAPVPAAKPAPQAPVAGVKKVVAPTPQQVVDATGFALPEAALRYGARTPKVNTFKVPAPEPEKQLKTSAPSSQKPLAVDPYANLPAQLADQLRKADAAAAAKSQPAVTKKVAAPAVPARRPDTKLGGPVQTLAPVPLGVEARERARAKAADAAIIVKRDTATAAKLKQGAAAASLQAMRLKQQAQAKAQAVYQAQVAQRQFTAAEAARASASGQILYSDYRYTPGQSYTLSGEDMAFQPQSVQGSSRWQTGY